MASGMFSTKGRYALRAMGDLAQHPGWVSLGDISERQHISRKYLEQVIALMHRAGYVESMRGKGGGYRLTRKPEEYTLGQILRAAEGSSPLLRAWIVRTTRSVRLWTPARPSRCGAT